MSNTGSTDEVTSLPPTTMEHMYERILSEIKSLRMNVVTLVDENTKRVGEIAEIGRRVGMRGEIQTDYEGILTSDNENASFDGENLPDPKPEERERVGAHGREQRNVGTDRRELPYTRRREPTIAERRKQGSSSTSREENLYEATRNVGWNVTENQISARDAIRAIKPLNGQDDAGVEEFIRKVEKIRQQCSQPDLLLDFILAEKIQQQAERAIRFNDIYIYDDLYEALRENLKQVGSVSHLRSKLDSCRQGATETTQNFSIRFRGIMNELKYAVQSSHKGPVKRRIALDIEETECLQKYLMNLRREIGLQVKAQKPTNIGEAQNMATEMETWLKESQPRVPIREPQYQPKKEFRPANIQPRSQANTTPRVPNQSMPLASRMEMKCHKCGKLGHFANQCYAKQNFQQGHFPKRPPNPVRNIQEEETNYLDQRKMTQEEIEEQKAYEEGAEYQVYAENFYPYEENDEMEQYTAY